MKRLFFSFIAFLLSCTPAFSLTYNYELQGLITYSDYDNAYGYDPLLMSEKPHFDFSVCGATSALKHILLLME
jgi:hypothetical protein